MPDKIDSLPSMEHLVTDRDMVEVLIRENTLLSMQKAELEVVVQKLLQFIDEGEVAVDGNEPPKPSPAHRGV